MQSEAVVDGGPIAVVRLIRLMALMEQTVRLAVALSLYLLNPLTRSPALL